MHLKPQPFSCHAPYQGKSYNRATTTARMVILCKLVRQLFISSANSIISCFYFPL
uniref:Uncharacterized protein n=1 Tax=Rhizophora mucronata TaxID=61149 RepID=A0A2P2PIP8_RHIMU